MKRTLYYTTFILAITLLFSYGTISAQVEVSPSHRGSDVFSFLDYIKKGGYVSPAYLPGVTASASDKPIGPDRFVKAPGNDLFALATGPMTIGAAPTWYAGTNNGGSLEGGESVDCQEGSGFPYFAWYAGGAPNESTSVQSTVWYYFVIVGGPTTVYVNMQDNTGASYVGIRAYYHGMSVWNTLVLPTTACHPLQCMDNEDVGAVNWIWTGYKGAACGTDYQPAFTKYSEELYNLPTGTYYIQVGYPVNNDATDAFKVSVTTTAQAGYTLTNPPPTTTNVGGACNGGAMIPTQSPLVEEYINLPSGSNRCDNGAGGCTSCPPAGGGLCSPCAAAINDSSLGQGVSISTGGVAPYPAANAAFGTAGGEVPPGYCISYCYTFKTNINSQNSINIQDYNGFNGLNYTASGCTDIHWLAGGACANYIYWFPDGPDRAGCFGGNVYWLDWTLYNANCGSIISCGGFNAGSNTITVNGTACSTNFVICVSKQLLYNTYLVNDLVDGAGGPYGVIPYATYTSCPPTACSALPISLASFQVDYNQIGNSVTIYWSTATQVNNKLFTVEKSLNGVDWKTVTTQAGAGNSSEMLYYSAVDEDPWAGISYYRLKQTDFDGAYTYSDIATENIPSDYAVNVFPNPTKGDMTLQYTSSSPDPINVKITDMSGTLLSSYRINEVQKGQNQFEVNTSTLGSGMYIMQVSNYQKTFYLKFVKQ